MATSDYNNAYKSALGSKKAPPKEEGGEREYQFEVDGKSYTGSWSGDKRPTKQQEIDLVKKTQAKRGKK